VKTWGCWNLGKLIFGEFRSLENKDIKGNCKINKTHILQPNIG
jgi:hypothetical protein